MPASRRFQTAGVCIPQFHYMVDVSNMVEQITEKYIKNGNYFSINRARQYGKTTTLEQLCRHLKQKSKDYIVLYLSFESADDCFFSLYSFAQGFSNKVAVALEENEIPEEAAAIWAEPVSRELPLDSLNRKITRFCRACSRKVVLIIDEVDKSSDNQIFLSFLGLLREKYLAGAAGRGKTFHSVILAGVYDIKNLKLKLRPGEESKYNSPWNIAADFTLDMSFSPKDIAGMLIDYQQDHSMEMNIEELADLIYSYTNGYPYLVSYICKYVDEAEAASWTRAGILDAVRQLVKGPNTLYDDMIKHVEEYPELREMLSNILFSGQDYPYHEYDQPVSIGRMFGFIVNRDGSVAVSNRIFENQLYEYFLTQETRKNEQQRTHLPCKNQFITDGNLNMDLVMRKFYEYYTELYSEEEEKFLEKFGRKIFLMFLKPIINGTGNFYVEDQSRTKLRSDIVIDYSGKQYVIECKIWHGDAYHRRGEKQLAEYLDAYHVNKGYLLSFDFNKNKKTGIHTILFQGKELLEVVV